MTQPSHRIYTFDLLRGLAVLTMMLAHSVYFFHTRENLWLLGLETFGNTVSFVTFLVVSGAVAWVAYFGGHRGHQPVNRRRVMGRVLWFLLAYYVLSLILVAPEIMRAEGFERIRLALNVLTFRHLPGYTEYFPPFIFYAVLMGLLPRLFWLIGRSLKNVLLVSLLSFLVGYLLYQVPTGSFLRPWVAVLAGAEGLFRFPLLQYFPVFLLGLYWGHQTLSSQGLPAKRFLASRLFGFFLYLSIIAYLVAYFLDIPLEFIFSRWPPTLPFIALGLGFAFLAATLLYRVRQLRRVRLLRDFLLMFGQNALGLFWSHIFLLGVYAAAGGTQVSSVGMFFFLFLLLMILSVALTTFLPFNFRLALTSIRGSHEEHEEALEEVAVFRLSKDVAAEAVETGQGLRNFFFPDPATQNRRVLRRRHQLGLSIVAIVTAVLIFPATTEEVALQRQERGADIWWSEDYAYRQPVTLQNTESFVTIQPNTPVAIPFNHQKLVEQGRSRADGQDIKLVYWTGEKHLVADTIVANPGSPQASLKFKIPEKIEGSQPDQFYSIYYGSFGAVAPTTPALEAKTSLKATYKLEETYPLVASVSTTWNVIGEPGDETVALHLTSLKSYESETVNYQVLDTDQTGLMLRSSPTSWEADIPVASLPPGAYRVQATLREADGQGHTSHVTGFYRSHPLYVAWTHDWEGYDVNQTYLDAMEDIATQYQLPITHFFNPRVFITGGIRPQRAQALTQWLQQRLQLGDGFGLHLHLFYDLVEKAGVEVRKDPNWGDRGDGYGVPLATYTQAEQTKLIEYALDLLFANGLPRTTLFRAGGWFANLDTFKALETLGFTVDSSARTKYQFGRNKLQGYWQVSATARPYYPSRTNQNVGTPINPFPILEIPNNGADSFAFSAQAMIDRFTLNLGAGILDQPQQITYLSHPHWFDEAEQGRVRELFTYISRYRFIDDQGPVIFTKTETIAEIFKDAQ